MKKADKPAIAAIIREMIEANELVLNETMAEVVRERLGLPVSRSDISRLRSEIGLKLYDLARRDAERDVREDTRHVQSEFDSVGVPNVPDVAALQIVILRRENKELREKVDELSAKLEKAMRKSA